MSHHVLGHQTVPIRGSWCLRFTGSGRLTSAAVQAAGQLKTTDCAPIALLAVGFLAKKSVSLYDIGFSEVPDRRVKTRRVLVKKRCNSSHVADAPCARRTGSEVVTPTVTVATATVATTTTTATATVADACKNVSLEGPYRSVHVRHSDALCDRGLTLEGQHLSSGDW